jgi:hypothetical protein
MTKISKPLFDKSLLDKITIKHPNYTLGVDTYDKKSFAYCLSSKKVSGEFEVLLCKTMTNEEEFNQEVANLAKYFNADIIKTL